MIFSNKKKKKFRNEMFVVTKNKILKLYCMNEFLSLNELPETDRAMRIGPDKIILTKGSNSVAKH